MSQLFTSNPSNSPELTLRSAYLVLCNSTHQALEATNLTQGGDSWWIVYDTSLLNEDKAEQEKNLILANLGSPPMGARAPLYACDTATLLDALSEGFRQLYKKVVVDIRIGALDKASIARLILASMAGTRIMLVGADCHVEQAIKSRMQEAAYIGFGNSWVADIRELEVVENISNFAVAA